MKVRIVYRVNGLSESEYKPQRKILGLWRAWPHYSWCEVDGRQTFDNEDEARQFLDEKIDEHLKRYTASRGIL